MKKKELPERIDRDEDIIIKKVIDREKYPLFEDRVAIPNGAIDELLSKSHCIFYTYSLILSIKEEEFRLGEIFKIPVKDVKDVRNFYWKGIRGLVRAGYMAKCSEKRYLVFAEKRIVRPRLKK